MRVSVAEMKHDDLEQFGEERVYLAYISTVLHHRKSGQEFKQGRTLEAVADAKVKERYCLPACST